MFVPPPEAVPPKKQFLELCSIPRFCRRTMRPFRDAFNGQRLTSGWVRCDRLSHCQNRN